MKAQYSFAILRYVHDVVTGEFANIAALVYSPSLHFLEMRPLDNFARLNRFFGAVPARHIKSVTRQLRSAVDDLADDLFNKLFVAKLPQDALECARQVLPFDDSSLQFANLGFGVTSNPWHALERIYMRYVGRYATSTRAEGRRDDEIWKAFRKPLLETVPAVHLEPHVIAARNYEHEFPFSWRNGIINVAEPISFDLRDPRDILDKANRWLGRGTSLRESSEKFRIVLLLGEPTDPSVQPSFERAQNILATIPGQKEIFTEKDPLSFADFVRITMEHVDPNQRM